MAITSNVLIGRAHGSVGNATFSTWKGKNVLKSKAVSVANPRTPGQLMRRSAFTQVTNIARLIYAVISLGFSKLAVGKTVSNAFASDALKNAFNYSTPPDAIFEPGSMKISKGNVANTSIESLAADVSQGNISGSFSTLVTGPGQAVTDTMLAAAYNITRDEWVVNETATTRVDGAFTIALPTLWVAGNLLEFYLGFYSNVTGNSSDSVASTTTVIA